MHEPTYRQALSHAWHVVRHNKILWIFGCIAVLMGQFGASGLVGDFLYPSGRIGSLWTFVQNIVTLSSYNSYNAVWLFWLGIVVVAVGFLAMVAAASAQGALIAQGGMWFARRRNLSADTAWHAGASQWWPLFMVTVTEKILLTVLLLVSLTALDALVSVEYAVHFLGALITVALGVVLALVISVISIYTKGYIVIDNAPVADAIKRGARLFGRHLLVSLETSIMLVLLSLALVMVLVIGTVLAFIPTTVFSFLALTTGMGGLVMVGWLLTLMAISLLVLLVGGIFNAFTVITWTYLFMKMHHEGVASRVMRWLGARRAH